MIPLVKRIMADRKPLYLQSIVVTWNFALSIFSMAGARRPPRVVAASDPVGLSSTRYERCRGARCAERMPPPPLVGGDARR
eukprot:2631072-Prymnesium_polylepis.1